MILALGGISGLEIRFNHKPAPRPVFIRVIHPVQGQGRKLCSTAVSLRPKNGQPAKTALGDGPHGFFLTNPLTCERCGVHITVRRSSIFFGSGARSHVVRAKRGLRIVV